MNNDIVLRLSKDLRDVSQRLTDTEARYLVDGYYTIQEYRKAMDNQLRSMSANNSEPSLVLSWLAENVHRLETQIKYALGKYASAHKVGIWAQSIVGIGPVISSGLLAHIDIEKAPTAGHIWSFAGLSNHEWNKGQKRPWNARLKTLTWKIGESFVKVQNHKDDIYGKIYSQRKQYEQEKNERGDYAEQARLKLEKFKIGKSTEAYKVYSVGKLPKGHIHERAKRVAVKLFLSHLHEAWYLHHYGKAPPIPYAISILGHADRILCPNLNLINGVVGSG
jgi:hypothetical protein